MSIVELKKDAPTDAPFAVGDVVHLRSGGVLVTVRRVGKHQRDGVTMVAVDWMDVNETLCSAEFDARQLQAPEEPSSDDG